MANALGKYGINLLLTMSKLRYLLFVLHPSSDSGILFDFMAVYWHYPL